MNLTQYLKKTRKSGRKYSEVKKLFLDIVLGVDYMHARGYIHRDLKPENVLIFDKKHKKTAKLCDFGLAKKFLKYERNTPNVVTSWYRAPEIYLEYSYSKKIDIWSIGCLLYEMLKSIPLLTCNDDPKTSVQTILSKLPYDVPNETVSKMNNLNIEIENERLIEDFKSFLTLRKTTLEEYVGDDYDNLKDLLLKCLSFDPDDRLTTIEILEHDYFSDFPNVINSILDRFNNINEEEEKIHIVRCNERGWMEEDIMAIINEAIIKKNNIYRWCTDKVIFYSISVFDRFLSYQSGNLSPEEETDDQGMFFTKEKSRLYFLMTLYFCSNYFSTLDTPIPFEEMFEDKFKDLYSNNDGKLNYILRKFESRLIKILEYKIETKIFYDHCVDNMIFEDHEDIYSILILIFAGHHHNRYLSELYDLFISKRELYLEEARSYIASLNDDSYE